MLCTPFFYGVGGIPSYLIAPCSKGTSSLLPPTSYLLRSVWSVTVPYPPKVPILLVTSCLTYLT